MLPSETAGDGFVCNIELELAGLKMLHLGETVPPKKITAGNLKSILIACRYTQREKLHCVALSNLHYQLYQAELHCVIYYQFTAKRGRG